MLCLAIATASPAMAAAPTADDSLAAMRATLSSVPGYAGVFGLIRGDQIATGVIGDQKPGVAHVRDAPVRWASVSKMVLAIMVLQQVDLGLSALDDPLTRYLPDTPIAKCGTHHDPSAVGASLGVGRAGGSG